MSPYDLMCIYFMLQQLKLGLPLELNIIIRVHMLIIQAPRPVQLA